MTRARMPRPHEVAAARRDPRLLRALRDRRSRRCLAHPRRLPERGPGDVLSGAQRAGRRGGGALPHAVTSRAPAWPGRWRSATATACGAAPRRASGGPCWSPGAARSESDPRCGRRRRPAGAGPAAHPGAAELTRSAPAQNGRVPAASRHRHPARSGPGRHSTCRPARRRALLVLGHGAGGGVDAPTCSRCATRPCGAGLVVARVTQPYRVAGRRAPAPAGHLDEAWTDGAGRAAPSAPDVPLLVGGRSSGARVACRTARRGWARPGWSRWPFRCTRPAGRSAPGPPNWPPALPTLVVNGDRDPFGRPARRRPGRGGGAPGRTARPAPGPGRHGRGGRRPGCVPHGWAADAPARSDPCRRQPPRIDAVYRAPAERRCIRRCRRPDSGRRDRPPRPFLVPAPAADRSPGPGAGGRWNARRGPALRPPERRFWREG